MAAFLKGEWLDSGRLAREASGLKPDCLASDQRAPEASGPKEEDLASDRQALVVSGPKHRHSGTAIGRALRLRPATNATEM